jgi:hypothetical protein
VVKRLRRQEVRQELKLCNGNLFDLSTIHHEQNMEMRRLGGGRGKISLQEKIKEVEI